MHRVIGVDVMVLTWAAGSGIGPSPQESDMLDHSGRHEGVVYIPRPKRKSPFPVVPANTSRI